MTYLINVKILNMYSVHSCINLLIASRCLLIINEIGYVHSFGNEWTYKIESYPW